MDFLKKLWGNRTRQAKSDKTVVLREDRAQESEHHGRKASTANQATPPPFAAKSVMGYRQGMEDAYSVVPAVVSIPEAWAWPLSLPSDRTISMNDEDGQDPETLAETSHETQPPVGDQYSDLHLYAVYDGHGGASVSEHCKNHLHEHLRKAVARHLNQEKKPSQVFQHIGSLKGHGCSPRSSAGADNDDIGPEKVEVGIRAALIDSFLSIDKELFKKGTAKEMGTTAVVALIGPSHLWVANCGDSRAIVSRGHSVITLSSDHKANRPDEMARVQEAGGFVWWKRVQGELAISRAIGDHKLRPYVIAKPEVTRMERHVDDRLLILASDGVWDVLSNEEVCRIALAELERDLTEEDGNAKSSLNNVAALLADTALKRGSRDNVTVLVVDLRSPEGLH